MASGGSRKGAGRGSKWGEKRVEIGVPLSIGNELLAAIEYLWDKGIRGQEMIGALYSAEHRKIRRYDYPVSAGSHSTSGVGGDSMNNNYEEINLLEALIEEPSKTMIIPVTGDSMIGIGIYPGDWLIVEQINPLYETPKEEDIVIASVNDEVLVKRFRKERGEIVLISENENHKPIRLSEGSIYISGIVKSSIRRNLSKT